MKENKLVDLSKQFAVDIVNLCTEIKESRKGNVLLNQLLKSGTSIGANIHEANYAASNRLLKEKPKPNILLTSLILIIRKERCYAKFIY